MTQPCSFSQFSQIYCISLKRCEERRTHIEQEFMRVGIEKYEFVDAYDKNSKEVSRLYNSKFVKKFPPCFRCGLDTCECENKSLFRPQIGNWLSHLKTWKSIAATGKRLSLVCEDDVKFQENIDMATTVVAESEAVQLTLQKAQPILIRFGWALCAEHRQSGIPQLTEQIRMANPCYAINAAMAKHLVTSLKEINTTSDVYLHKIIGPSVTHFTVMPPSAYELSWSTGDIASEIRPKKIRIRKLHEELQTLEHLDPEYQVTKISYEREIDRLNQYEQFNASPSTNYEDKFDLI